MIDTPGFGEAVDNTECWTPILDYVEDQFDGYLEAETRVERVEVGDIDDNDNDDNNDNDTNDDNYDCRCGTAECTPVSTSSRPRATV